MVHGMGKLEGNADNVRGSLIPQYLVLRRVPMRYRRILPLTVMKRFQCIVIGSAPGVLTVAITDRQNTPVIESLRRFTGKAIFPVLIDPTRMRLLIQRIERYEQYRVATYISADRDARKTKYYQYAMLRLEICSIAVLLSSQMTKRL
jgi:type II secretion system (T2SS) protein E